MRFVVMTRVGDRDAGDSRRGSSTFVTNQLRSVAFAHVFVAWRGPAKFQDRWIRTSTQPAATKNHAQQFAAPERLAIATNPSHLQ
jgi:hypothetical protein